MDSIFDIKTLVFSTGFTCIVLSILSLTFSSALPSRSKSLMCWSLALFLIGLAFGMISLRGIAFPFITFYISNIFILSGGSLFPVSYSLYYSKYNFFRPLLLSNLISFVFISFDYFKYGEEINKQRPIYILTLAVIYFSLCVYWIIKNEKPKMGIYSKLSVVTFTLLITFCLARIISVIFDQPNSRSLVESSQIQFVFMVTVGVIVIFGGLSFLLMSFEQVQNEILKKTALAEQVQRFKSIGILASGVAHEVNNPLAIISVSLENLKKQIPENSPSYDKILKSISRANEAVIRVATIAKSLLEISHLNKTSDKELTNTNSILEGTFAFCREKFTAQSVKLEILNETKEEFYCHRVEIIHILIALLDNALEATLKLENSKRYVQIKTQLNENFLEFQILNSGASIPIELRPHLFTKNLSNLNSDLSSGLSLSLAKSIADRNNAKLSFDSQSETTTFVLSIPLQK